MISLHLDPFAHRPLENLLPDLVLAADEGPKLGCARRRGDL